MQPLRHAASGQAPAGACAQTGDVSRDAHVTRRGLLFPLTCAAGQEAEGCSRAARPLTAAPFATAPIISLSYLIRRHQSELHTSWRSLHPFTTLFPNLFFRSCFCALRVVAGTRCSVARALFRPARRPQPGLSDALSNLILGLILDVNRPELTHIACMSVLLPPDTDTCSVALQPASQNARTRAVT